MPAGSNAAFTRFMSAIWSAESSIDRYGALGEADAVLAADRSLERHDTLEEQTFGLTRALQFVCVALVHHQIDVNVPISGVTERRDAKTKLAREIAYGIEQLRNSPAWHDDVVVDLQQSGCA